MDINKLWQMSRKASKLYHKFSISKGNGKVRWIEAPCPTLKGVQKELLENILYTVLPHKAAHGFVPQRSIVTNAAPHVGKEWVANFDIKGFFPATKTRIVKQTLDRHYRDRWDPETWEADLRAILRLVCRNGALPQGAPTSPHIANLAMYEADVKLQEYSDSHGLSYTRYADDLTFSGEQLPSDLRRFVCAAIRPQGYKIAPGKSKWLGRNKRQMVTGLVVNDKINLPRPQRKTLRANLHDAKQNGNAALARSGFLVEQLEGKIALQKLLELRQALA